jgi:hypothetical protein
MLHPDRHRCSPAQTVDWPVVSCKAAADPVRWALGLAVATQHTPCRHTPAHRLSEHAQWFLVGATAAVVPNAVLYITEVLQEKAGRCWE